MTVRLLRAFGGVPAGGAYDGSADDELALVNAGNATWETRSAGAQGGPGDSSGGGATDHGALTGLADDDHSQYHNDARGDARYAPIAEGVTNGDTHDHSGGDGGQIAYGSLSGVPTIYNQTIQDEGSSVTQRATVNFVGAGVTVSDSGGKTQVSVPGGGVNTDYTAAQLETMRGSGTLSAGTLYAASDTGALYWAHSVSTLDPLGGPVYIQESATSFAIATAALTAIGTGGQFDVRGYDTLTLSYKNTHSTALSGFDIAIKQGSGAWIVTHSAAGDFITAGDDLLIDLSTDDADLDLTTLTNAKTATLRLDVRGVDYVRFRAQQATSDGTCDWYSTKES